MQRTKPVFVSILAFIIILYVLFKEFIYDIGYISDVIYGFLWGLLVGLYYENFIVRDPDSGEVRSVTA